MIDIEELSSILKKKGIEYQTENLEKIIAEHDYYGTK